jgi:hypothetical protein
VVPNKLFVGGSGVREKLRQNINLTMTVPVGQLEILELENEGLRDFERAGLSNSVDRPVVRELDGNFGIGDDSRECSAVESRAIPMRDRKLERTVMP